MAIMELISHDISVVIKMHKTPKNAYGSGWFGITPKEFVVHMGDYNGFETFIHEYNHFQQYLYDPYLWDRCRLSIGKFHKHVEGKSTKLPDQQCFSVIDLEHDCEIRSMQMIRDLKLPVKLREYAQQANHYLYSHILAQHFRCWPLIRVCNTMPSKIFELSHYKDISNVPIELFKVFEKASLG